MHIEKLVCFLIEDNDTWFFISLSAYIGLYKMIGLTKIDKGSEYGTRDSKKEE